MTQQHENRRVRMTKQLMKNALLELLEHQELVNISVTAICETADVHRSTFYKYYTDPAGLLREIEQDFLDRIPAPPQILDQQNQEALLTATSEFFDFIRENKKTFRILFNDSSGNSFNARLVEYLCNGYVPVRDDTDEQSSRFIQIYIANGTVGMMREWVNTDFRISSQDLAEMMYFLSKKISQY
ncbi:MAG: TetR/AcrR family transcriptional regulator [Mogibacterium sp.]|nr:TetR/AcrR family transcriptional regulator [Mogibacterium sp.]